MSLMLAINGWDRESWLQRFRSALPEKTIVLASDKGDSRDLDSRGVTYIACWKHTAGSLARFTDTRVLFSLGAGVDHLMGDHALPNAPIVRMVDPDLTGRMTEWVVWQCLDWLRQGTVYRGQQRARQWLDDRHQPAAQDIRVGVMGLGVLGCDALARLQAMRFEVAGWSRSPKTIAGVKTYAGKDVLAVFLGRTDILVVLLPLTVDTHGLLNAELFGQLAQNGRLGGPVLINAGRGGLQVEKDIVDALDAGILKGASLDVFETEPLPLESPFWTRNDVHVTPHNAAMSHPDAIAKAIATQIRAFEAGLPLQNVVERGRGY